MNRHNIVYGETDDMLTAEWADRAPDDLDRYTDDTTIFIRVSEPKDGTSQARIELDQKMKNAIAAWIAERN